jgi:hypothetical protein
MLKLFFLDSITLLQVLKILFSTKCFKEIYFFDSISPTSERIQNSHFLSTILRYKIQKVENHVGELRLGNGENLLKIIHTDARKIINRIKSNELEANSFLHSLQLIWDKKKLVHYFERKVEVLINRECRRIRLTKWLALKRGKEQDIIPQFIISHTKYQKYLKEYAEKERVDFKTYCQFSFRVMRLVISKATKWIFRSVFLKSLSAKGKILFIKKKKLGGTKPKTETIIRSKIGIKYSYQGLDLDLSKRSEFFWLHNRKIPFNDIVVHSYTSDRQIDSKIKTKLDKKRVKIFGTAPGVPPWSPTFLFFKQMFGTGFDISKIVVLCLIKHKYFSPYYIFHIFYLVPQYSYWYDFFASNHIRINIDSTYSSSHGLTLALDKLGGISFAYQYSISDLNYPTSLLSYGENVQFSFSSRFTENLWEKVNLPGDLILDIGYIFDYTMVKSEANCSLNKVKKKFDENGVKFIVCFFDENSLNRWDIPAPDEEAAEDYKNLFQWLLNDPTIGLICKPKRALDLFNRIKSISDLLEQALDTKRCHFLINDTMVRDIFPAQAAHFADCCIGKLGGGTAAMEAVIAGVPTLLMDTEGNHSHPFYQNSNGACIFRTWQLLKEIVEQYRKNIENCPTFGDWSPFIDELVSYKDGRSRERFEDFIFDTHIALNQGKTRNDAIKFAMARFSKKWGILEASDCQYLSN